MFSGVCELILELHVSVCVSGWFCILARALRRVFVSVGVSKYMYVCLCVCVCVCVDMDFQVLLGALKCVLRVCVCAC